MFDRLLIMLQVLDCPCASEYRIVGGDPEGHEPSIG
jgi:hypothetical protein